MKKIKVRFKSLMGNGRHAVFVKKSKLEYANLCWFMRLMGPLYITSMRFLSLLLNNIITSMSSKDQIIFYL